METRQRAAAGIILRRSIIYGALGLLVALGITVVWLLASLRFNFSGMTGEVKPVVTAEGARLPEVISQRRKTYAEGQPLVKPKAPVVPDPPVLEARIPPTQAEKPPAPAAQAPPQAAQATTPNPFRWAGREQEQAPPPPTKPGGLPSATTTPAQPTQAPRQGRQTQAPPAQQRQPSVQAQEQTRRSGNWLTKTFTRIPDDEEDERAPRPRPPQGVLPGMPSGEDRGTKPPGTTGTTGTTGSPKERAQALFPPAVWATPADPTRVLYSSQRLQGLLLTSINTDIPGDIVIIVTEPVEDKFMQGQVLVPQYTVLLGSQDGQIKYGQARVPAKFHKMELPNGTDVAFEGNAGDRTGASGIPGKVDNHWPQVILGAGISAILSIGSQVTFGGSTQGYNPTLEQQFAREFGQGLNQAGQKVVERELKRNPTITQKYGYAVTVSFRDNISFQSEPIIVRK